ncbi:MAG: NAD(P)-binding domain-containing protein [bacterium]|nr:NAD(P)-binding domain-containing protein [bacterium]
MSLIPSICVVGAAGQMGNGLLLRLIESTESGTEVSIVHAVDVDYDGLRTRWTSDNNRVKIHKAIVDAVQASEVVILAIPYHAEQQLSDDVRASMAGKIVVSITNPLTATLDDVLTPHHESAAECLAAMLPGARVVKALNTISASALTLPRTTSLNYDTFVASDHEDAALVVENIIRALGYRPWYVGTLKLSRTLERMTALLIGISQRYALNGPLGWNVQGVQPD